jgi:hypothetical protein
MNVPVTYWALYAARRFDVAGTLSWWLNAHLATMRNNIQATKNHKNEKVQKIIFLQVGTVWQA